MPPAVVRVMSTDPATSVGEVALHEVVEEQLTEVPAVEPNMAVVAPVTKPVPVIETTVPANSGPAEGVTEVTVGIAS